MSKTTVFCLVFLGLLNSVFSQSEEKYIVNAAGSTNIIGSNIYISSFGETVTGDNGSVSSGFLYAYDTLYITATPLPHNVTNQYEFYPNPAHDYISVHSISPISEILITDVNGRFIKNHVLEKFTESYRIDLTDFSIGVYLLSIKTSDGVFTVKMIKQ